MAYTTINKSSEHFNPLLYTGNTSNGHEINGLDFQPDFVWIKSRNQADFSHMLYDVVRASTTAQPFEIRSNLTNAQSTDTSGLVSFDSDGFTLNSGGYVNTGNFVSWNWKAGGSPSSNTDGSITSSVSANTTAGFSIVTFTGTGANATVGHGLGSVPKMIIIKGYSNTPNWQVYHASYGNTGGGQLNLNSAFSADGMFQNTTPTSSVFSLGTSGNVNGSGQTMVAYCFADVKGFSKFGKYVGNGNADGTFVYTGFKPAFVLKKNITNAREWNMEDNKRIGYNPNNYGLFPHNADTEQTGFHRVNFLSNGFKLKTNSEHWNESGNNFIYMAFAEAPLVGSNNVPANAR